MVNVLLVGSNSEGGRVRQWRTQLEDRGINPRVFMDDAVLMNREDRSVLATQLGLDLRTAEIVWLLWPSSRLGTGDAGYVLGFVQALREQGATKCRRIIATGKATHESAGAARADYVDVFDNLGFHDLCNHAQKIVTARAHQGDGRMSIDRTKLRAIIHDLDVGGMAAVQRSIESLKAIGAVRNQHVGRTGMEPGSDECAEWYAGQVLNVLEGESWFAVNSIINCVDKFAPETM